MARKRRTTAAEVAAAAFLKAQKAERKAERASRRVARLERQIAESPPPENAIGFRVEHDCDEDEIPAEVRRK